MTDNTPIDNTSTQTLLADQPDSQGLDMTDTTKEHELLPCPRCNWENPRLKKCMDYVKVVCEICDKDLTVSCGYNGFDLVTQEKAVEHVISGWNSPDIRRWLNGNATQPHAAARGVETLLERIKELEGENHRLKVKLEIVEENIRASTSIL